MKTFTKALVGTVAAGAMAVSAASPALARDRHDGGINAGDVIAGALVIGGIAALIGAVSDKNDNRYRDDRVSYGGYDHRHNRDWNRGRAGSPRSAVEQCVAAAERNAGRHTYGRADVTDIRKVKQTRYGYEVQGRIAVNRNLRSNDRGSFKCRVDGGRVVHLDYNGIRGL